MRVDPRGSPLPSTVYIGGLCTVDEDMSSYHSMRVLAKGRRRRDQAGVSKLGEERDIISMKGGVNDPGTKPCGVCEAGRFN